MHQITVADQVIDVVRKNIKNLRLTVYPPDGRVRIAAPLHANDEAVHEFVISKLAWIKKHQAKFASQVRPAPLEYVSGESHYYQGERYFLNVIDQPGAPKVVIRDQSTLNLYVRPESDLVQRRGVMNAWYRQQLKAQIPPLIEKWQPIMGVTVQAWGVKQMKTRWGTCNIRARRIWLNLELAKRPPRCLEYIVVHEMVHLLERLHNARFRAFMDQFLPHWRSCKEELKHISA